MQLWLLWIAIVIAVKHQDFKTCSQSSFCSRNRALADKAAAAGAAWDRKYQLDEGSINVESGHFIATVLKTVNNESAYPEGTGHVQLALDVTFLMSGAVRYALDEKRRQAGDITLRGENKGSVRKERYNEVSKWVIVGGLNVDKNVKITRLDGSTKILYGPSHAYECRIDHNTLVVQFLRDGEVHVLLNDRGLLNVDHWRAKKDEVDSTDEEQQEGMWEETFGGKTDSKIRGPESVAMDVTFPNYKHVYGIPEHATSLSLKTTRGGEGNYNDPYRLYNADVFEYETDSPMTLYGSIPFMQAHRKSSDAGVFWLTGAETWIDIIKEESNKATFGAQGATQTHWMSESGVMDIFVFLGPDSSKLFHDFGELVGYTALPQYAGLAYHQCRWNYISQDDVKDVDLQFDQHNIPYDVIWLDVEYLDGKRYFTWDASNFADPEDLLVHLDSKKRKLVGIIDPHIKKDDTYWVYSEIKNQDLAMKDSSFNTYDGWCWPGSSVWVDCFNPAAVKWWKSLFPFNRFLGSRSNLWIWNDMNEPSVFNGPEVTAPKDNIHYGGWEHRDVHNLNGLTFHNATAEALVERDPKKPTRPFVLTRAFAPGTQRLGPMWTGDNQANWEHLKISIPMLLSIGVGGLTFAGADVGGFFGNPSNELLARWYQAGAFYPFFRAHAHIDTKRREPYLAGDPWTSVMRDAINLRYQLLPVFYTSIHRSSVDGMPILRPQYVMFPDDEQGFAIDDQFHVGDSGLLSKPVTDEGAEAVSIYLADSENYFDYWTSRLYRGPGHVQLDAPLEKIPLLLRGGHILARKDRIRRSAPLMKFDPYTLVVAVGSDGAASGELYIDDGVSYNFKKGEYVHRRFTFSTKDNTIRSEDLHPASRSAKKYIKQIEDVRISKIVLLGFDEYTKASNAKGIQFDKTWDIEKTTSINEGTSVTTLRTPNVEIAHDWQIVIE